MATETSKVSLEIETKGFVTAAQALTRINTSMDKLDKVISKLAKNSGMDTINKLTKKLERQQQTIANLTATHKASVRAQVSENKKLAASLKAITREQEKTKKLMLKGDATSYRKITKETANRKIAEEKLKAAIRETNKVQKEQVKTMKAEDKAIRESIKGINGRLRSLERLNKTQLQYEATIKKLKDEIRALKGEEVQFVSNTDRLNDAIKRANGTITTHKGLIAQVVTTNRASKQLMAETTVIVKAQQKAIDRLNLAIAQTNNVQDKAILISKRKALEDEKLKIQATASLASQKMQRDAMSKLQGTMSKLSTGVRNVGRMFTRYLTPAMMAAVVAGIKMAATIETQIVRFGVLTGSIEKGAKLYKEIVEFSAVTPFQLPDLDKAAQILLAFGSPLKTVMNELKMLGDIAMGDAEKLERIVTSFGKVRSRGTAHMRELNRFIMAGVPIFQELRKNIGGTGEDLFKMVAKNEITFEHINQAVVSLTAEGGRFHEMTLKTSQTLEGRFSTALDNLKLNLASVFDIFTDDLKAMLEGFIDWSQGFRLLSDDVRGNIGKMIVGIAAIGPALVALSGGIKLVTSAYVGLKLAHSALNPVYAILVGLAAIVTVVAVKFKSLKTELDKAGEAAKKVADYTEQMNKADKVAQVQIPLMSQELFETAKNYDLVALAIGRVVQAQELQRKLDKGFDGSDAEKQAKKDFKKEAPILFPGKGVAGFGDNIFDEIGGAIASVGFSEKPFAFYEKSLNEAFNEIASKNDTYKQRVIDLIGEDLTISESELTALFGTQGDHGEAFEKFFTDSLKFPTKEEFLANTETDWRETLTQTIIDLLDPQKLLEAGGVIDKNPLQTFLNSITTTMFASLDNTSFDDALATSSSMINQLLENKKKIENEFMTFKKSDTAKYGADRELLAKAVAPGSEYYALGLRGLNADLDKATEAYEQAMDDFDTNLLIAVNSRLLEIEQEPQREGLILQLLGISDEKDVVKTLEDQLDLISGELAGLDYSFDDITAMIAGKIDTPPVVQKLIDAAKGVQEKLDVQLAHKDRISLFGTFFEGDIKETEITKIENDIKAALDKLSTAMAGNKIELKEGETITDVLFGHMQAGTINEFIGNMDDATQEAYAKVANLYDKLQALNVEAETTESHRTLIEAMVGTPEDFTAYINSLELERLYGELETTMNSLVEGSNISVLDLAKGIDMSKIGKVGEEINFDEIFAGADSLPLTLNNTNEELVRMIGYLREIGVLKPFEELEDLDSKEAVLKSFGEGVKDMLIGTILPAFETLGKSIAESASGLETWSNVFTGIGSAIMKALPQLMLQAGLTLLGNTDKTDDGLGWGLIAGSGALSIANGMIGADKISTPTTSATSISYSAKGDVFDKGYITDGALMRSTNYGISMIGEDGREAVMPLTRSSSGKLGVQGSGRGDVYVNVTNNTSANVTQEVRENKDGTKSIEFLITETVKRGMASGVYDNTLQKTYGNVRRGR